MRHRRHTQRLCFAVSITQTTKDLQRLKMMIQPRVWLVGVREPVPDPVQAVREELVLPTCT